MSKRIFNQEQINTLLANKHVQRCSERSITYTTDFKLKAIEQYEAGLTSTEIFKQAGFNLDLIGKDTPKGCLRRWRKIHKDKGNNGLSDTRGKIGVPRVNKPKLYGAKRLKYLEAEVKYLKAENTFLAQLRAKKVE